MRSTLLASAFALCAWLFPANPAAYAQGTGTSGEIRGTVTDPAGGTIPKATVEVTDPEKGISRSVVTESDGLYEVAGLSPSTYTVTVQITGFQTETHKNVVLNVGQTLVLDFHLRVAAGTAEIVVTGESPVVETQRGSQANTLTQNYIVDLPIDRRDYLTFTLLLPGVSDSTRLADDQDFRVKQTPQSGLSFYGSNGRGNSITVDGGEASGDSGGVRTTVSQDAVQEFQVNRSNYGADLGGASGASINIVTKSGTNDLHGSLFGYFRNDGMDARDPFAFSQALQPGGPFSFTEQGQPIKNSLSRQQFGGSLGGPLRKDKTFLFAAFEGLRQDSENAVPLLTQSSIFQGPSASAPVNFQSADPRFAQQSVVSALASLPGNPMVPCFGNPSNPPIVPLPAQFCALALQNALTVSPVTGTPGTSQTAINNYLINQLETNGGLFNYSTRQYLFSARLDHRIDDSNQLSFGYRYGHDLEENPDVQSLTGFSAGSSIHTYDNNAQASWYHEFNSNTGNELRVQYDYNSFNVIPNEPGQAGLQILGFANNLGTNIFLPNFTILRRYEFADNVSLVRGHHTIKFGGDELLRGNHSESHTFFPGRFVFGPLPGAAVSLCFLPGNPNPCGLATQGANINSLQAASLSAPQVYQQGFGNADYPAYTRPLTGLFLQDAWNITSTFKLTYGVRYEIDSQFKPLNTYYGDVSPRLSFAWDPFKDHKTVIRGGYGIFYGPIDAQIPQVDLSLGVLNADKSTVENHNNKAQVPDQVNNAVGTCGVGVTAFGAPGVIVPGTGSSPCNRYISIYIDPGFSLLPFLQPAGKVFTGLFNQGLIQCTTPTAPNSACITPAAVQQFGIFVQNSGQLSPLTVLFSNPPNYKPPYSQQASVGIEREIVPGLSVSVSGIYTHTLRLPVAIDTNLLPTTPTSTVPLANGGTYTYKNWNLSPLTDPLGGVEGLPCAPSKGFACFVNPLLIQNNQYTSAASALYEAGILEVKERFNNRFTLFGNYTFSKGFDTSTDFNTDYGPQDPTNLSLDRGLSEFDQRHKVVIAGVFDSPWKQAILSGFQLSPIFTYHSGLPFNLLAGGAINGNNHITNERPFGAPRDSGLGPDYYDFDMRLSWRHKVGEKANLVLTAEGFNLANHTNYASVNNEVGPVFGLPAALGGGGNTTFNVHGIAPNFTTITPSTPLAFTSAFPKRQIQLGVRLTF
jgi:hypothetical protein